MIKKRLVWVIVAIIVLGSGYLVINAFTHKKGSHVAMLGQPPSWPINTSSAGSVGKQLSNNHCTGSGTVPLTSGPMHPADIANIQPYGLTVGGHVTPVDHQYYYAKNNVKDSSDVLALADGRLADIEFRDHHGQGPIPGDYRAVISYTCTFMSYFDLATSLAPDIAAQLPKGWEANGHTSINIPVKAGQAVAKMGGQSLDFAIWDTTYNNPKLVVPTAYSGETWKIHTVNPLDVFTPAVKTSLLPFYVRTVEPRDGQYAYDVAGKLVGSWFLKGSGGYNTQQAAGANSYWTGHLAIAPDYIDPTVWGFSIGTYNGGDATQFVIKPPLTDPTTIGVESGLVKLELLHIARYKQADGSEWNGLSAPNSALTMSTTGVSAATALVQLIDANTLKVELFPGKMPDQVTAFDSAAKTYTRSGR